jgi:hypothetical protein
MFWRNNGKSNRPRRRPIRHTLLTLLELEERLVPTLLGQQLFPSDYPWNQNISNAPVVANSAAIISHIGTSVKIHPDWGQDSASNGSNPLYGIPFNVVHGNTTTKVNVTIDNYPGESDIVPVPIPAGAVIEGDFQNGPNSNVASRGDSHLLVWDEDNNIAYELYLASRPSENADGKWHAGQESVWNMNTDSFRSLGWTSADAAGLSILAGLARPDEGLPTSQGGQGIITHALRFTLPSGDVNPQYIYPASHVVSDSSGSTKLPFGARLRLMNTTAVNNIINGLGPEAQIIAHAMQQYGLVLADIGSAMYVSGSSASEDANNKINFTWDMNDVLGLAGLNAGDFEVVNLAPVVTGLSVSSGSAGNSVTVTGQNFSGSAGHLTVFFGSTPATSVTYVDDSHLIVAVPNGSGTVNVTVQSGVNATDPNNPSDNVNNPVFGYGTSVIVAADQFTYGSSGVSISGGNSTASFATSSVASGSTDTLTLVVKDTTGNAVSGLASSAFSFVLSGGSSAGTFGTVTETATKGTYTVSFAGTTAGSASTLTITVSGVSLTTKPTVSITTGPVSGSNSTASFATSTVASGSSDTITIMVKDAASNAITGLAGTAFGLSFSGGTSAGTLGTVTETTTKGTYTATFTGTTAGTASTLTVTVSGVTLTARPTVQVSSGGISAANSTVSFASPGVISGNTDTVTIVVQDINGNAVSGLGSGAFSFSLYVGTSAGTFGTVTETATKGTYTAMFTGTKAGTASTLTVTVSSVTLNTKPAVTVTPGSISGATSTDSFATSTVASGGTDTVTIVLKDAAGNAITGLASGAFGFALSGGTSAGTFGTVTESTTKGTYTATFTGTTAGTTSTLTVTVSGATLTTKSMVQVTSGVISGTNSTVNLATSSVASGSTDAVTIVVKDTAGNAVSGLGNGAFGFNMSGGTSAGTFGTVTETATKGTYTALFSGTTAGTASTLTVTIGGVTLTTTPAVTVSVGPVSGANSTPSFASSSVASGGIDTLTIVVKDGAGNAVSGLASGAFGVTRSSGTSAGTFSTVTETATKGTYTATFTGITAGSAATLTVTVSGVTLSTKPGVTVTAGPVSGANSTASFATPTVSSGGTDTLTITIKDAAGNAVSGLASGAFGFTLTGGTSAGLFGTVSETATRGTYTVTFSGTTAGTASTLTTKVNGVTLTGSGVTITVSPASPSPVVVSQMSSQGVWEYNRASGTWTQLTPANATILADDSTGEVAGEFPGSGVWEYLPASGWKQLTTPDASALVMDAQGNITGEFAGSGVWQYLPGSGWKQLTKVDASVLAAGASAWVVGDFKGSGVWEYQPASGWKQLTTSDASLLAMDAQLDVTGEFQGSGVWQYTSTAGWKQLTVSNATALTAGASGEVVADFTGSGVWRYRAASGWSQLTPSDATRLEDVNGSVFGEFVGSGVWELDPGTGWFKLTATDVSILVAS